MKRRPLTFPRLTQSLSLALAVGAMSVVMFTIGTAIGAWTAGWPGPSRRCRTPESEEWFV